MKNKWKKAAAGLLATALAFGCVPAKEGTGVFGGIGSGVTVYAESAVSWTSGDCTVTYDPATGTITVTGNGAMADYTDEYDENPAPWLSICTSVTSIVISDGVTSIGDYAFYGSRNMTSLTIADTVKTIGNRAFCFCDSCRDITIPASVTSIGNSAIYTVAISDRTIKFVRPSSESTLTIGFMNFYNGNTVSYSGDGKYTLFSGDTDMDLSALSVNNKTETLNDKTFIWKLPVYTITDRSVNGTVTASVNGTDVTEAEYDDTVLLTVAPANGYRFKSVTAGVSKDSAEELSDLVALMGDAVFEGDEVSFPGYTFKVENGKFVIYNGTTLVAELSESNMTDFTVDSFRTVATCGDVRWSFKVSDGKITDISVMNTSTWDQLFYPPYGSFESTGSLPLADIELTTVTEGAQYSFKMPKKPVIVTAEFEDAEIADTYTATVTDNGTVTGYGTLADAVAAWTDGSTLTLMADAELAERITITGNKTIDLNGYGLKSTVDGQQVFSIADADGDSSLTINDGASTRTNTGSNRPEGIVGGYLTGGHNDNYGWGGGIYLGNGDTLTLNGGTITGNSAYNGGGVVINGATFNMNGGAITNNTAVQGGDIGGGGVYVANGGTFNMSGGTISKNSAQWGAGVGANGAVFNLTGGVITENTAAANGWGGGAFVTINSTFTVSGSPVVCDNYKGTDLSNVHLQEYTGTTAKMTIESPGLADGADIGVYQYTLDNFEFTKNYGSIHGETAPTKFFTSDRKMKMVITEQGEVKTTNEEYIVTVTYKVVGGTWADGSTEDKTESIDGKTKPLSVPTGMIASDGYTGGAWDTDPTDVTVAEDTTFTYTFEMDPGAAAVAELLKAIPSADDITTEIKGAIEVARKAYNALTDDQKALISDDTLKKLTDAEDALAALETGDTINALPAAGDVTTDDADAIKAARDAYNALTDDQKALISDDTLKKLTDAEEALAALEEANNHSAVKANVVNGNGIMFTAGIDTLKYKEVGFIFEANGKEVRRGTNTVYSSIDGSEYGVSDFDNANYIYSFTIEDIADAGTEIKVTPYSIDLKGKETKGETQTYSITQLNAGGGALHMLVYSNDDIVSGGAIAFYGADVNTDEENAPVKAEETADEPDKEEANVTEIKLVEVEEVLE